MSERIQTIDYSVDVLKSLLWEHDNAERLKYLIKKKQEFIDVAHRDFWDGWYRDVFDVNTANDFGLEVWSRILNIRLNATIEPGSKAAVFGFGATNKNFGNGSFYRQSAGEVGVITEQKRLIIKLRYLQLVSRATVPETNRVLKDLFSDQGNVFVVDSNDMTFSTYFFTFAPDSQTQFILEKYDLLPRPSGVGVKYQISVRPSFGFGQFNLNFNNSTFGA